MIVTTQETLKLSGYSTCEIIIQILGCLVFSILLCLKVEEVLTASWWYIFVPLFTADALTLYFSAIVYIRLFNVNDKKAANKREIWIVITLSLLFLFKMLLVYKLEGTLNISSSSVLAPLIALWILTMFNSCRVKS